MDLASQFAALLERERAQTAFNTALSSKVDGLSSQIDELTSTVARVSTENAHLSSEVQRLSRELRAEQKTNVELSKAAAPAGHWVWEQSTAGDGEEGRWVWSLEKLACVPCPVASHSPPATLLTLPVEVFGLVFELLSPSTRSSLASVSTSLLELAAPILAAQKLVLNAEQTLDWICNRLGQSSIRSDRITPLLVSNAIVLAGDAPSDHLREMLQVHLGTIPGQSIVVNTLGLALASIEDLCRWAPFLCRLNPHRFDLLVSADGSRPLQPAVRLMPQSEVDAFSASWDRLEVHLAAGPGSVLVLSERPSELALGDCLRRDAPNGPGSWEVVVALIKQELNQEVEQQIFAENTLRNFWVMRRKLRTTSLKGSRPISNARLSK